MRYFKLSITGDARKSLRLYAAMNNFRLNEALLDAVQLAAASRGQSLGFTPANRARVEQAASQQGGD